MFKIDKQVGLTSHEVTQLRAKYGFNEILEKQETIFVWFIKKLLNPITLMIQLALILSIVAHKVEDSIIILALLLVNIGIEMWQEHKSSKALEAIKNTLQLTAVALRDGKFKSVPTRELVPGDILKLVLGDIAPADVKVLGKDILQVDQSTITGESQVAEKTKGDTIYASSIIQSGSSLVEVISIGTKTFIGKSTQLVAKAQASECSHFQQAIIGIGKFLAILSAILIVLISVALLYKGDSLVEVVQFALILAIASIPVALPAVLSVTMAVGASALSKYNAIVSNFKAVEELAGTDILCVDKTGTLTKNELSINKPIVYNNYNLIDLLSYALLASEKEHKNKIELAIEKSASDLGIDLGKLFKTNKVIKFISFTPVTKTTQAYIKSQNQEDFSIEMGATQAIVKLLSDKKIISQVESDVAKLAQDGMRSMAIVKKTKEKVELVGLLPMIDPPREDSKEVLNFMKSYGVSVKMITGDNTAVARFIASKLNLGTKLIDTKEFNKSKDKITLIHSTDIFTEVVPEDKYNIISALQKEGHIVAMTGDGVNDAPALKKADIGIAVSGASPAARAAADVVLLDDGLSTIKVALEHSRMIFARMQGYATFRIAETIRIIFFVSLTIFFLGFTPLSAIMIVLLALLNDIPVMAMAYDNAEVDKSPMRWNLRETITISSVLGATGLASSFLLLYVLYIYNTPLAIIYTIMFLKLDVSGHSTLYTTRTGRRHFWQRPFPSLKFFLPAFSSRIIGTILALFGIFMEPISITAVIIIWIYSTIWFLLNDQIKVMVYKMIDKNRKMV